VHTHKHTRAHTINHAQEQQRLKSAAEASMQHMGTFARPSVMNNFRRLSILPIQGVYRFPSVYTYSLNLRFISLDTVVSKNPDVTGNFCQFHVLQL